MSRADAVRALFLAERRMRPKGSTARGDYHLSMNAPALPIGSRLSRSSGARALVIVAVVALGIFAPLASMLVAQRETARLVVLNEAQSMRAQRIAFLALAAHDGTAPADWRTEMRTTVDELAAGSKVLAARHDIAPVAADATGQTPVARAVKAYIAAANALLRDPRDGAALASILGHRRALNELQERMVGARTQIVEDRLTRILVVAVVSIVVMLASLWVMWTRIIAPSERRTARLVANLHASQEEIKSLFRENPDAIAVWDLDGRLVRGNAASIALLQLDERALGSHYLDYVIASDAAEAAATFDRARHGDRVGFDTKFVSAGREAIDVSVSLFPKIIDGHIRGVIGVAKDRRALRHAEAAFESQTERITELCRIFAYQNKPALLQIEETLAIAAQRLGYDWAVALDIVDGDVLTIGMGYAAPDGAIADREEVAAFARRFLVREDEVWAIDRLAAGPAGSPRAVAGARITVGSVMSGLLVLGSRSYCHAPMPTGDREFLRLVSALVGAAVQRGEHEQKLDTLAFFDGLTALPNRVTLAERFRTTLFASQHQGRQFAVHCLDLDRFKSINDGFGHAVGDDVLRIAARRMERCVRSTDTIARVGGDEFVILQGLDGDASAATELADRIIEAIAQPMSIGGIEHVIGVSVGISLFPRDGTDADSLVCAADHALLRAKRAGRNRRTMTIA